MTLTTPAPEAPEAPATARELPEWDEPAGSTARGTVIVLAGRGEAGGVYERFGRRLSADAYRVRVVEDATADLPAARSRVAALLADPALPSPKVLVGSDAGAALALHAVAGADVDVDNVALSSRPSAIAGLVLVGLPLGTSPADTAGPVDDTELRSACPVHRRTLTDPALVTVGALTRPLPEELTPARATRLRQGLPILAIHGEADLVSPVDDAVAFYRTLDAARILTIADGRHDALNDVSHRSVAAAIVLFLERIRLAGAGDLPRVLNDVSEPAS